MGKVSIWQLEQRQGLSLEIKIKKSKLLIEEWYRYYDGMVYVAFSGGKDSTVLLHLVRSLYPDVPAVFVDTGLEFPEVRKFVKATPNVIWLKPNLPFRQIIGKYGYPIISKQQAQFIYEYRHTKSDYMKKIRIEGHPKWGRQSIISKKWRYLIDAPFEISDFCCDIMKKNPFKRFEKDTGFEPYLALMASDNRMRKMSYLRLGCNSFEGWTQSNPLGFWLESDIWEYIKTFNVPYSTIYDMGYKNTGCMFCMFGVHLEDEPNRFQRMKLTHPKIHSYCMNNLGIKEVLKYIDVKYE